MTWPLTITQTIAVMTGPAAYKVFAEAVDALPPISDTSSYWLTWIYNFLQTLAANKSKMVNRKPTQAAKSTTAPNPFTFTAK